MDYALAGVLALVISFILIQLIGSRRKISRGRIIYRQSDTHNFLKEFFSRDTNIKSKKSQLTQRQEKDTTKIVVTEENSILGN